MGVSDKYLLGVIPGGNLVQYSLITRICIRFLGNDTERRMCRNTSKDLVYNVT
jgi:hypothetical protein